jgi:undecaprenyl diphosphate synthase
MTHFLFCDGAATDIYVTETLWPDFREPQFLEALGQFQSRERRFGRTGEQTDREHLRAAH